MLDDNEFQMKETGPAWYNKRGWRLAGLGIFLLVITAWMLFAADAEGILGHADEIGYSVCHQIELRSFHIGDRAMPLCARCSGMYLGAALGLIFLLITNKRKSGLPKWQVILFFGLLASTFASDGVNSAIKLYTGNGLLYDPNNFLRMTTGSFMGLAIAIALTSAFNQTLWKQMDTRRLLDSPREIGFLIVLDAVLILSIISENPLILYPLSIISAVMVPVLLTIIYTMVFLMIFRIENRMSSYRELFFPACIGFIVAAGQIIIINWVRFQLIGGVEHLITG